MSSLGTSQKEELPKGWSYPIGVEGLSRWLSDIPGVTCAGLYFVAKSRASAVAFERQRKRNEPYLVLSLGLKQKERDSLHPSIPSWSAVIYAVPGTLRNVTRRALEECVLPRLKGWLLVTRSDTQLNGGAGFQLHIREIGPTFAITTRESAFDAETRDEFSVTEEQTKRM